MSDGTRDEPVQVSVVIAAYDDRERLHECLLSVSRQRDPDGNTEIIVVDDGSTDGTADMVRREHPAVRLVTGDNRGAEVARNRGVDEARGEIVAFIDSDCTAEPGWLQGMADNLRTDPLLVVGGRVVHRGTFRQRLIGIADFGEYQGPKAREVRALPTCSMGLRKELFEKVRFDPRLRPNADTLLSEGLRRLGATLRYQPEIVVRHNPTATAAELRARARRYGRSFVEARRLDPGLRWSNFVRAGVPGVVAATLGRAVLDWTRLLLHRKAAGFRWWEVPPAVACLLQRRIASLPEAVRACRKR
ncbi:MAG: glycosyltransferase [Acidobacteria bacterium]|jgi:glycosyltransferase involved in cell wall biosynthesis|nr:glycosyltransferase [Acidobacteriota bacterium]